MFTNPFDKEDSITESSLFCAVFPVFQDPPFSRRRWPSVIFSIPPSFSVPPFFYPATGSPVATVFQFVHLKNIPYGGILKKERTRRR